MALSVALFRRARKPDVEEKLKLTEDLYRSVVQTQTDLICRYLPDTTLTFVNDAYCRNFGRKREELIGTKFIDLIPVERHEECLQHIASLLDNPRTVGYTHEVIRSDGGVGYQQWVDHAILDADGRVTEFQGIGRDVTDLKLTERELQQQRDQVAHLTRVATLGELTGAIAHELNQPLAAIINNAQAGELMLENGVHDVDQLRAILKDIADDDLRAGQIIRRLHGLLKKGEFTPERVDVGQLVGEALALVHGPFLEQRIELVCEIQESPLPILGDRTQLLQLMLNLLMNASEATSGNPPGERELRVTATAGESDDVVVAVADNGGGFAPGDSDRLFEPFYTTKADGLGLGLCVSRSIVTVHGGRLEAWNNERGSTFAFTLPQADGDAQHSATSADQ